MSKAKKTSPAPPVINPSATEIRKARAEAGLTQAQAAAMVHANLRSWQKWEAGDREMHPAFWELFEIKLEALKKV